MDLEQPLALAYMLHLYELYRSHISEEDLGNLRGLEAFEGNEVYCYQHQKRVSVLVDF